MPDQVHILTGFWTGLKRCVGSAKIQAAIGGLTSSWVVLHYETAGLPPTQRVAAIIAFQGAVLVVLREIVASWSAEDIAKTVASAPPPPAPPTVQSAAGNIVNEQPPAKIPGDDPPPAATAPPTRPKLPTVAKPVVDRIKL